MGRGALGRGLCAASVVVVGLMFARHAECADAAFPPPIEEHHLANGLRVVLAPDDMMSDVSLVVRYEAGQGDDPVRREGLAHVTEHVLFGAFRHCAHAKLLLQAGASNLNAHTGLDFTSFEETVSPEALDLALWLEGARMATAADVVDEAEVVRERTVAGLEYRQYGHGGRGLLALGPLFEAEWDELYPEWHPYHYAPDALAALNRIDPADVRAFAATWYRPNNASLVLAGHFESGRALDLVQKYFGRIPARPAPSRPVLPSLPAPGNLWLDVEALVTHPLAIMAWRAPTSHAPEDRALTVAAQLLTAPHGALGPTFLNDDTGALHITVQKMSSVGGAVFVVGVEPREGLSLAKLLPAVQATMAAFPDHVTEGDVADARKRLSDEQLLNLETSMGRALRLADSHGKASWGIDEYDSVDRGSVVDAIRRFLAPEQRVTMVVRPATRPLFGASAVLLHRDRMAR
jgi:zinc protease